MNHRLKDSRSKPGWLRALALGTAGSFAWSFVLATPVQALTHLPTPKREGVRTLSAAEMSAMFGAQGHPTAVAIDSGSTYPWEESVAGVNTGNGNKTTSIPIVGWAGRGGGGVSFAVTHNSQSAHISELGQKWTHSYDLYMVSSTVGGVTKKTVHWGDDLSYAFTQNVDGSYSAPTGIHDKLVKNGDNTYTLTKTNQVKYHYTTALYCDTITPPNGNALAIAYNAGNYVTTVTDATGRVLTFAYDGSNRISTMTDPLSRVWTFAYNGSNDLTSISEPALGGTTYSTSFTYNSGHDITDILSRRSAQHLRLQRLSRFDLGEGRRAQPDELNVHQRGHGRHRPQRAREDLYLHDRTGVSSDGRGGAEPELHLRQSQQQDADDGRTRLQLGIDV